MFEHYEIIEINNAKEFFMFGYHNPLFLTEKDYEWINWYAEGAKAVTGPPLSERLQTLAGFYASFLCRSKRNERFFLEKNNVLYWLKPTEEAMKNVEW